MLIQISLFKLMFFRFLLLLKFHTISLGGTAASTRTLCLELLLFFLLVNTSTAPENLSRISRPTTQKTIKASSTGGVAEKIKKKKDCLELAILIEKEGA